MDGRFGEPCTPPCSSSASRLLLAASSSFSSICVAALPALTTRYHGTLNVPIMVFTAVLLRSHQRSRSFSESASVGSLGNQCTDPRKRSLSFHSSGTPSTST